MRHTSGLTSVPAPRGPSRFVWIDARDSAAAELLQGCQVVTVDGESMGTVEGILLDAMTHQTRYVMLTPFSGGASVAIPWHALYLDSTRVRLVFYTYC